MICTSTKSLSLYDLIIKDVDRSWYSNSNVQIITLHKLAHIANKATESTKVVDYKDWQISLKSQRFQKSLKLRMVLRSYGIQWFRGWWSLLIYWCVVGATLTEDRNVKSETLKPIFTCLSRVRCWTANNYASTPECVRNINHSLCTSLNFKDRKVCVSVIYASLCTWQLYLMADAQAKKDDEDLAANHHWIFIYKRVNYMNGPYFLGKSAWLVPNSSF